MILQEACDGVGQFAAFVGVRSFDRTYADVDTKIAGNLKEPLLFSLAHFVGRGFPVVPTHLDHFIRDSVINKARPELRIKPNNSRVVPMLVAELVL